MGDFDSTNGSWLNSVKVGPGELKLLRHGDVVQVADAVLRVSASADFLKGVGSFSILIFTGVQFTKEIFLPEDGHTIGVSFREGDWLFKEPSTGLEQVIVSRVDKELKISARPGLYPIMLNGEELKEKA